MLKKFFKLSNLKYFIAFLLPLVFTMLINNTLDSDSWYVLAEGREITTNGIYYTDQLSMHEGLDVVVQNYGFATIFYWVYSIFGAAGVYICILLLNILICYLLYKILMLITNKNVNLSLLLMLATNLILIPWFVVTRAQMVSYVFFLSLIYILELYIKTKHKKYLWWLPLLSLLQSNLHASLWPMLILVMAVYIIDGIKAPKLNLQGYDIKPLITITIIMLLAGLINPYGIKMLTLMFSSYGNQTFMELVNELQPFNLRSPINIFVYCAIILSLLPQIFGNKKHIKIRYLIMYFGFLALGLNSAKGMSQFILIMFLPIATMYKTTKIKIPSKYLKLCSTTTTCLTIFISCSLTIILPALLILLPNYPDKALKEAFDQIDQTTENTIDKKTTLYTGYNDGGYAEWRGYAPYLDPRGEVFLEKNNHKADILQEWYDFMLRKIDSATFLEKYQFDYILVSTDEDPFYGLKSSTYSEIYRSEDATTILYQKKSTP